MHHHTPRRQQTPSHTQGPPRSQDHQELKSKLKTNKATVTRADKGNTLVILPTEQYNSKMENFTQANNLQTMPTDPTKTYQNSVRKTINSSKTLIPRDTKWKYANMNPSAPTIKGLIKLHKQNQPIRPVVDWQNAPAYKLAKLFTLPHKDCMTLTLVVGLAWSNESRSYTGGSVATGSVSHARLVCDEDPD
jgi:hypothetical protein